MRRRKPIRFVLFSFLIHLGILKGIDAFLLPTPGIPEPPRIIPVQTVLIEEQKEEELFSSGLAFTETGFPKDAVVAKVQTAMGTPGPASIEDFPGPIPREGSFKPSLNVEQIPVPGVLPPGQKGKEAESRRIISPSVSPPLQLPATPPSVSDQAPLLEAEEVKVLAQAEEGGIPIYSMTLEKTSAPLGRNRPDPEFISDLLPIPTVRSPLLPEEREMVLAKPESLQPDTSISATPRSLKGSKALGKRIAESRWDKPFSERIGTLGPLIGGLERQGASVTAEKGFSMMLVLDTSGSVKGEPLDGIKKSAIVFVSLLGDMDRCSIMTFDDEASLVVPFTSDKDALNRAIRRLSVEGRNTVLFDALDQAFLLLGKELDKRRFVVLFSDGKDEGSRSTLDEVINKARSSQISVFSVGYSRIEKGYLRNLESISLETGGIFAEAPHFREIVDLFKAARGSKRNKGV